jgi:iron complex transport system permease protein
MKTTLLFIALIAVALAAFWFDNGRALDLAAVFSGDAANIDRFVALDIRLPRILTGILIGIGLAACGVLMQAVFHNPLANEFTLGTSAGAALGALAAMVLIPGIPAPWIGVAAFAGALAVSLPTMLVSIRKAVALEAVLLTGVALSFAAVALGSALTFVSAFSLQGGAISKWSMGSLHLTDKTDLWLLGVSAALPAGLCFVMRGKLDAMLAGEEWALARGVDTAKVRGVAILAVALSIGISVALCGPIGFIGLMAPHMARGVSGGTVSKIAVSAPLIGALVLVTCDYAARNAMADPLPTGVMTAGLGTPVLVVLLMRRFRRRG